jgi:hypothetical protein
MYKEHTSFRSPTDPNVKIWRYMNLDKFLHFITSGCLYFASSDQLGDPMEGSYTKADLAWMEKQVSLELKSKILSHGEASRSSYKMSCWHMAENESLSMWRSYTDRGQGIVVQSTFNRFKDSLLKSADDVFIGEVDYVDHYADEIPQLGNDFNRFLKKDGSFSYEKELRAIRLCAKIKDGRWNYDDIPKRQDSLVEVNLTLLIESIIVSPFTAEWLQEALQKVVKQFYPAMNVEFSGLKKVPIFSSE